MRMGQDIPEVDAVLFMDPVTSPRDIIQASGRAMRLHGPPGEKRATVYVPILGDRRLVSSAAEQEEIKKAENAVRAQVRIGTVSFVEQHSQFEHIAPQC
jgi:predicted helicase